MAAGIPVDTLGISPIAVFQNTRNVGGTNRVQHEALVVTRVGGCLFKTPKGVMHASLEDDGTWRYPSFRSQGGQESDLRVAFDTAGRMAFYGMAEPLPDHGSTRAGSAPHHPLTTGPAGDKDRSCSARVSDRKVADRSIDHPTWAIHASAHAPDSILPDLAEGLAHGGGLRETNHDRAAQRTSQIIARRPPPTPLRACPTSLRR